MPAVDRGGAAHIAARDPAVVPPHRDPARQLRRKDPQAVRAVRGPGVEHRPQQVRGQQLAAQQRRVEAVQVVERGHQLTRRAGHARVEFGDVGAVGRVGVAVRGGQRGAGAREGRAREPEGVDDAAPGLGGVRVAGDPPDDHAEHGVVGAGVRVPAEAGGRQGERDAYGLKRGQGDGSPGDPGEVGEPAGVVEQGAQGDPASVGAVSAQQSRQVPLHGVGQGQPVLRGQLQDDGGDEGLGDAAGAEVVGAGDVPAGGRVADVVAVVVQEGGGRCSAFGDEL